MSKTGEGVVSYEEAKCRILEGLRDSSVLVPLSVVADFAWPKHTMRRQGAAFAASKIMSRMQEEGLVRWAAGEYGRGWTYLRRPAR